MKYRKKPVEIEAVKVDYIEDAIAFADFGMIGYNTADKADDDEWEVWDELHGTWVSFKRGDWIIRGIAGEFYPCVDEVFVETYEPVPEPEQLELPFDEAGTITVG